MYIINPSFRIPFTSYLYMCTALKKTNAMDTVNMKILITAFLCTFIIAVHSARSNSSLLESKIEGGCKYKRDNKKFKQSLMALIVFKSSAIDTRYHFRAMGTFFSKKSVLTSMKCAVAVKLDMANHRVIKLPVLNENALEIHNAAFTTEKEDEFLSSYGIIILCENANIELEGHINLLPVEDKYYQQEYSFYSPGFVWENNEPILSYLILRFINREECQRSLNQFEYKLRMNEICLRPHDGQFEDEDDGTPLYARYNKVLGIANSFDFQEAQIIIYTDLADQTDRIIEFLRRNEITAEQEDADTHQLSRSRSLNDQRRGKWNMEGSSPYLQPIDSKPIVALSKNSRKGRHPQTSNSGIRTWDEGEGSSSYEVDPDLKLRLQPSPERELGYINLGFSNMHITPDISTARYRECEIEEEESSRESNTEIPPQEYPISPILRENIEELPRFKKDNDESTISCNIFRLPFKKFIRKLSIRPSCTEKKSRDF